jgi:hypothetical protein
MYFCIVQDHDVGKGKVVPMLPLTEHYAMKA